MRSNPMTQIHKLSFFKRIRFLRRFFFLFAHFFKQIKFLYNHKHTTMLKKKKTKHNMITTLNINLDISWNCITHHSLPQCPQRRSGQLTLAEVLPGRPTRLWHRGQQLRHLLSQVSQGRVGDHFLPEQPPGWFLPLLRG